MPVCGNASTWAKVALAIVIVALVLQCVGIGTRYWEQNETVQESTVIALGLWKGYNCSGGHNSACSSISIPSRYEDGAYNAVRGFQILVLILVFITALVFLFYVASDKFRELSIGIFIAVMCFITVTFGIIGMIIWLAQLPTDFYPGYSFGLSVFAVLLLFLAGILMIPDIRKFNKNKWKSDPTRVLPTDKPHKYDSVERNEYRSYNRKFTTPEPETSIRHYHNPNRMKYIGSPPPSYGRVSPAPMKKFRGSTYARSEIQTPDVYLGRDAKPLRRF